MVALTTARRDSSVDSPSVERAASPLRIAVAADADRAHWDGYVDSRNGASGYHAWDWRTVFAQAFGHQPIYLMAFRGDAVCGVLPLVFIKSVLFGRSLTSLPFLNYGGVLADDAEAARGLLDAAADSARRNRCAHVELRHRARQFPSLPARQHKVTMLLDLHEAGWEQLDKKVRNQIRKAEKSGLTVERGGIELLPEFYAVFARNMRDLGTPVYGKTFFETVLSTFPARAAVHVVRLERTPVAAGVTFQSGDTVEVPWASSVRDHNALCPNHLLYWSIIQSAAADGHAVLDFGRSTPGEGTFKFKEQWGARPLALHWEYLLQPGAVVPDTSPTNPKFHLAIEAWKRLPLGVATRLGPHIVGGIP